MKALTDVPICVVGAGAMGRGIAQVALAAGHEVSLVDPDQAQLDRARADITARLAKRDPEAGAKVEARLRTFSHLKAVAPRSDTVLVEAIVEDLAVKRALFSQASLIFGPDAILATNTSSLSITAIAAAAEDPSRVVGMHFFNPVPAMRLVEVVTGLQTSPEVAGAIDALGRSWGKTVARVRSVPGFIVNRVARAYYGESLRLLEEGAAGTGEIDELLRGAGFRMGPFELMDLIGNEVNYAVTTTIWKSYNYDPRFAPSLLQEELISAGRLGRKSGRGYYTYGDPTDETASGARAALEAATAPPLCELPAVVLHGEDPLLEGLLIRSGLPFDRERAGIRAFVQMGDLGRVVTTRGLSAVDETRESGTPTVVVDRALDAETVRALAVAGEHPGLFEAVAGFLSKAGVIAVPVGDVPGLVVARVLSMIANEAHETEYHGVATRADIDNAMTMGTNYPVGPFAWTVDWSPGAVLEILDNLADAYRDPRYRVSRALRVSAGR